MNATTSDYHFSTGDHIGFYLDILTATAYPDVSNGGLAQLLVDANTRAYFKLLPTTIRSKSAIEQYSPKQRGCLFEHELFEQYAGHYNFIDCLQKCKIQKVIQLCNCMPFFMPNNFPGNFGSPIKCTLADNKCLQQWGCNQNLYILKTSSSMLDQCIFNKSCILIADKIDAFVLQSTRFDRELMDESTECLECLPICTKTRFRIFSSHFPLNRETLEKSKLPIL